MFLEDRLEEIGDRMNDRNYNLLNKKEENVSRSFRRSKKQIADLKRRHVDWFYVQENDEARKRVLEEKRGKI